MGGPSTGPSSIEERDLRRLLDVVSPAVSSAVSSALSPAVYPQGDESQGPELPEQVLRGLADLIPCSSVSFFVMDPRRREVITSQSLDLREYPPDDETSDAVFWEGYWDCLACCTPEAIRGPGVASTWLDFYSEREFRRLRMAEYFAYFGMWHELVVCLPSRRGTTRRLALFRDGGDRPFSERDRLLLTLLRPHLTEMRDRVEAERVTVPALTPRQVELLRRLARGDTNRQLARDLGLSEATVRKHLENTYARLGAHSRTEALARAAALLVG